MTQETKKDAPGSKETTGENARNRDRRDKNTPPTKVVIRRLPPTMNVDIFLDQVSPLQDHDYMYFVKADMSLGQYAFARAYINFLHQEDVFIFKEKFDGYVFLDLKGNEYPAVVEFAPFQKIPKKKSKKKDAKCGTIEQDPDYIKFMESLQNPEEVVVPTAESYLEEIEARERELKANNGVLKMTTPLIEFLKHRKAERQRIREEKREERKKRELERKRIREEDRKRRKAEKDKEREKAKEKAAAKETSKDKDEKKVDDKTKSEPVMKLLKNPERDKEKDPEKDKDSQDSQKNQYLQQRRDKQQSSADSRSVRDVKEKSGNVRPVRDWEKERKRREEERHRQREKQRERERERRDRERVGKDDTRTGSASYSGKKSIGADEKSSDKDLSSCGKDKLEDTKDEKGEKDKPAVKRSDYGKLGKQDRYRDDYQGHGRNWDDWGNRSSDGRRGRGGSGNSRWGDDDRYRDGRRRSYESRGGKTSHDYRGNRISDHRDEREKQHKVLDKSGEKEGGIGRSKGNVDKKTDGKPDDRGSRDERYKNRDVEDDRYKGDKCYRDESSGGAEAKVARNYRHKSGDEPSSEDDKHIKDDDDAIVAASIGTISSSLPIVTAEEERERQENRGASDLVTADGNLSDSSGRKSEPRDENQDGSKDPRTDRKIRNRDRPSLELYRPGMRRLSMQRNSPQENVESPTPSSSPSPTPQMAKTPSANAPPFPIPKAETSDDGSGARSERGRSSSSMEN